MIPRPVRIEICMFSGLLLAIWAVSALFHFWPIVGKPFEWWHFAWAMTVVAGIGGPLVGGGIALGCWWYDKE